MANLALMAYMWSAISFSYYMLAIYMKYLPGNIYTNNISSGSAELLAYVCAGLLYSKFKIRLSFSGLQTLSVIGGICIIFLGSETESALMPFFVVLAKFGISGSFCILYVCMVDVFPTLFLVTALGVCNFFAKFLSIFASQVAERPAPLPMIIFCTLNALGIVVVQFVKTIKQ